MALASFYQRITRRLLLARNPAKEIRKLGLRLRGAKIGKGTEIPSVPGPTLRIGDRVFIGRGCEFNIRYGLTVGNDALIASGCVFIDHDHGRDAMTNKINSDCPGSPISVGEGAWIGAGAIVLKNVAIGKHAIIGAGSVVTRSVPDFQIWAGVPAKKVISK
jgi:acetyltransferase-like isoleucine patch superfamily enzyme